MKPEDRYTIGVDFAAGPDQTVAVVYDRTKRTFANWQGQTPMRYNIPRLVSVRHSIHEGARGALHWYFARYLFLKTHAVRDDGFLLALITSIDGLLPNDPRWKQ